MVVPPWLEHPADEEQSRHRYWCRTPMGLEQLALREMKDRLNVQESYLSKRNAFIKISSAVNQSELQRLRTVDDVFLYLGCFPGIDHTRAAVDDLMTHFATHILPQLPLQGYTYGRTTVSFVGKRNFNRFFIEQKVNELLATNTLLQPLSNELKMAKMPHELRLRCHLEDQHAFWGTGLFDTPLHRRPWRNLRYDGQLHPPVAAAMVREVEPASDAVWIDPFCGSGTLVIEAALQYPEQQFTGYDVSAEAIAIAQQSAAMAGAQVAFVQRDSLQSLPDQQDFVLISNPPWNEKYAIEGGWRGAFITGLSAWIAASQQTLLLLPEAGGQALQATGRWNVREIAQTRVRGKLVSLLRVK